MGCFPACFGHWKSIKNLQHQPLSPSHEGATLLAATTESLKEQDIYNPITLVQISEAKSEEQTNVDQGKEPVSGHSNIEECTNELTISKNDKLVENENDEVEKKREEGKDGDSLDSNLEKGNDVHKDFLVHHKECVAINSKETIYLDDNSSGEIFGDCCRKSQEEEEESSESLFSLSMDSRRRVYAAEVGEKEVTSPLKPIENSSKKIAQPSFKHGNDDEDKENAKEPMLKQPFVVESKAPSETAVSLSSWLVESEKSPQKTSIISVGDSPESEKNYGDRRILGAITELKQHLNEVPIPSCNADNQPRIGTVGRYWQRNVKTCEEVCDSSVFA